MSIVFNKDNSKFASIGNYGSSISIWDSNSFTISNSIGTKGFLLKELVFSPKGWELIAITTDCSLRFYDTRVKGGQLIRNVTNAHRGSVTTFSFSNNSEYFITGGQDHIVKLWDSDVNLETGQTQASPYYFQSFIGHTYPVQKVIFNPNNNS